MRSSWSTFFRFSRMISLFFWYFACKRGKKSCSIFPRIFVYFQVRNYQRALKYGKDRVNHKATAKFCTPSTFCKLLQCWIDVIRAMVNPRFLFDHTNSSSDPSNFKVHNMKPNTSLPTGPGPARQQTHTQLKVNHIPGSTKKLRFKHMQIKNSHHFTGVPIVVVAAPRKP